MCNGDENIEHVYILPSQLIDLFKYQSISNEIYENLQNASCTPEKGFFKEFFDSWHPKTHVSRKYCQSCYFAAIIQKWGGIYIYPFAEFWSVITRKRTRSSHKESDNNGTSLSSSDNEMTPKYKKKFQKNINANFNAFMTKRYEIIIKMDNDLYSFRPKRPKFVLTSFQHLLDSKLDRLTLQQLEFGMDSARYPDNYIF